MKALLQEIIDAGNLNKDMSLSMEVWHCGSSCCACGDVAVMRDKAAGVVDLSDAASAFAAELDQAAIKMFGNRAIDAAVYGPDADSRCYDATVAGLFTESELEHPHLNQDHNNREILHDFVRLLMAKCDEVGEKA